MRRFYSLILTFFLLFSSALALGDDRVDRLLSRLNKESSDSVRFEILLELSRSFNKEARTKVQCVDILNQALKIALVDSNYNYISRVHNNFGVLYRNISQYDTAIVYHQNAIDFALKASNNLLLASAYNSLGVVYRRMDNHPLATQYHLLGLKSAEIVRDTANIAVSLNSLGNIYSLNGQYNEAFRYFKRALDLAKAMNNVLGQAINYNNIGEVFEFMGVMDSAMVYYSKSLQANQSINSQKGIAISYNAIGKIHLYKGDAPKAYNLFFDALTIDLVLGDKKFIADSYINLGKALIALKDHRKAEEYTRKGLQLAKEIGSITHTQWAYEILSDIYNLKGQFNVALEYFKLASVYKDSLLNEKNTRAIAMMEVMYEMEKKEQEIRILRQTQEINKKELARQKTSRNLYFAAFLFSFLLLISVLNALSVKRKANAVLAQQKAEIEKSHKILSDQQNEIVKQNREIEFQRNSVEQKSKHLEEAYKVIEGYVGKITDSIRYAERIQKAILPPLTQTKKHFSDHFVFYKPKDFVSGDFYWLTIKNDTLYLAVADCTGHGVPGAFMSIIGMDLLSQAVNQLGITDPSKILDFLNIELRNKLRKEAGEELILKDSMDMAIITKKLGENKLTFSGALVPVTIVRQGKIVHHKPQFTSIGVSTKLFNRPFHQIEIDVFPNDWVYIFSDGYMDQFGERENKKFMRSRFFDSLCSISPLSGVNQAAELKRIFVEWRGNNEQIDDVLVLGLKV